MPEYLTNKQPLNTEMNLKKCDLCSCDQSKVIARFNSFTMVECERCSLVYMNPSPSEQYLVELYQGYHQRSGKDNMSWCRLMNINFEQTAKLLSDKFPSKGRLLDVGCGYGYFLAAMKEKGWDVVGVEPSANASEFARDELKIDVIQATLDSVNLPPASFDAISAFYVLEHLTNPGAALSKMYELLKPGGVLVLRVPHTTPIVKLLTVLKIQNNLFDMPFHLFDFSPKAIRVFLNNAGFSSCKITPGSPTLPDRAIEKIISVFFNWVCWGIYYCTLGKMLLPGPSKTIIANKQI